MPSSSAVAAEVPYLRRFSRALTGSQKAGDQLVAAMLEKLVADPSRFPASEPRIALYRALCKLWDALPAGTAVQPPEAGWELTANSRLSLLPLQARRVFLLAAVEGFSPSEIQEILEIDPVEFEELMNEATSQIAGMIATSVIIIEDEVLISMDLKNLVMGLGHRVIGIARTRDEAARLMAQDAPGLVISDIQLADGSSGISAVGDILQQFSVPVIFITAFPERLLTGSGLEPAFVVTKPYLAPAVRAMISQALFFNMTSENMG